MSNKSGLNETTMQIEARNEGGETSSRNDSEGPNGGHAMPTTESARSPSADCNPVQTPSNEEGKQPTPVPATGQQSAPVLATDQQPAAVPATARQSDETIENLVSLFRDFLETPNKGVSGPSHNIEQQNKEWRKKLFGLNKGFSQETDSNTNKYDYEQKYPRDRPGEEVAENSRIWLTYLDEAESFDHERAERWKDTVDVLLVFAGLFSGVITTFISQASQSLQKDNTQVSASLLFEAVQLLRANLNGVPASQVPSSTLTPTSPFTPSTVTLLVNGLWFASLAITLTTALFAGIAKQWLHYYLSSIPGSVNERVRARQLRLNGFESWKVPVIIDILPILLHLAVGLFLAGNIILLFPLDVRVAWTILIITSITYTLYLISVMLPIWYAECPYTSSLTIYTGFIFLVLRQVLRNIITILNGGFQALSRKIHFKARNTFRSFVQPGLIFILKLANAVSRGCQRLRSTIFGGNLPKIIKYNGFLRKIQLKSRCTVGHLIYFPRGLVQHGFMFIVKLADVVRRGSQRLRSNLPKLTKWREENIKKVIKNAAFLDIDALRWLHGTSSNQSVHRIIARSVAVHPFISKRFDKDVLTNLRCTLEISETNVVDLRYGLCLDLAARIVTSWKLLQSIPDVLQSQLEKQEYQSYLQIQAVGLWRYEEPQTLFNAIRDDLSLPLTMWCYLFEGTPSDDTDAVRILLCGPQGPFYWKFNPTHQLIRNAGLIRFNSEELGWWKFERLFRYFKLGNPDYSSEAKSYETRYHLLITIYRNLTSDHPLITDKAQRQNTLKYMFEDFWWYLNTSERLHTSENAEYCFTYFKEICCVDTFWCEVMTDDTRNSATKVLCQVYSWMNIPLCNHLNFADRHDLSLIYQWFSRDLDPSLSCVTPPLFALLLVPQNHHHLFTILSDDPDAVSHILKCLYNLTNINIHMEARIYEDLMNLLESVNPRNPRLFTILYSPSVLESLWKLIVSSGWDIKRYFLLVESKVDRHTLDELFVLMNGIAQSDDLVHVPPRVRSPEEFANKALLILKSTVPEFGQLLAENTASDKVKDTEGRVRATNHKTPHSVTNWTKKVLEFSRPKTSVKPTDQSADV